MLPFSRRGQKLDSLDQITLTASQNAVPSVSKRCQSDDVYCAQEWQEIAFPESSMTFETPADGLGTAHDITLDTLWFPRSSPLSDDTPQKIRRGLIAEKDLVFLDCCRQYPKAICWSLVLCLTVVMESYDKSLVAGFFAFPAFRRDYGQPTKGGYEIPSEWQIGLQNAAVGSEIIGLLAHGYLTYIFGYRKVMIGSLGWICVSTCPAFFAKNLTSLVVSLALSGIPWGVIQTLAATYAAEVVPAGMRACILSNINMCWIIGQLIGTSVLRASVQNPSEWSYRLPFALQWAWAVPLLVCIFFAPDSPWWFIRHERPEDARHALSRLSNQDDPKIEDSIALMEHINRAERKLNYGGATYADLFKGVNRRRTEIACMVWMCQAFTGFIGTTYAAYFFEQAGFDASNAFNLSAGMSGMALVGCIIACFLLAKVGRRKLYILGIWSTVVLFAGGGIASVVNEGSAASNWALGALLILATFTYNLTIGPVCYVIVAELPSTRLRVKTVAFARVLYNIVMVIFNILVPKMLNPTAWNLAGKTCFVFAGTSLFCLLWCYFRLPETKGLSYLELDILFEKKAPAAKFEQVQIRLAESAYMTASGAERLTNAWHGWVAYS